MGRSVPTICEVCPHKSCLKTGKPCDAVEALLPSPNEGRTVDVVDPERYRRAGVLADLRGRARPRIAAICALYYRCGWSQAEIAVALGCHRTNVTHQLQRATARYVKSVHISVTNRGIDT